MKVMKSDKWLLKWFGVTSIFLWASCCFSEQSRGQPFSLAGARGIFCLVPKGEPVPTEILNNSVISGITLRSGWKEIEPVEGKYDFSYFDREVSRCGKSGKKVAFIVPSGGKNIPSWLLSKKDLKKVLLRDGNKYHKDTFGKLIPVPLFWDPLLIDFRKKLIKAVSLHFKDNPFLELRTSR